MLHLSHQILAEIDSFISKLKRRQVFGSHAVSNETLRILRIIVSQGKWPNAQALINLLKSVGKRLAEAQPIELAVGNTVRRVLHQIREECDAIESDQPDEQKELVMTRSLSYTSGLVNLMGDTESSTINYTTISSRMSKTLFVEAIHDLMEDMKELHNNIAMHSLQHIHSNEIILTCGKSTTVETFFKYAAKTRQFQVIVVESAPNYSGRELAVNLSKMGIEVTFIPDSAVFAVMSRVNKVILGTHAVLANGGLISLSGTSVIASAAKYYSVPVVCLTGLYKLTPLYPYDLSIFNTLISPDSIFDYSASSPSSSLSYSQSNVDGDITVDIQNPYFDYVPPESITLFLTNANGYSPGYIYRLLTESYYKEDYVLESSPSYSSKYASGLMKDTMDAIGNVTAGGSGLDSTLSLDDSKSAKKDLRATSKTAFEDGDGEEDELDDGEDGVSVESEFDDNSDDGLDDGL
ncbi:hypothetical protein BKA69DRAFT_1082902 [Paraphysoderma sedebokerense]|nr:hypothetical protein BKA69DRAFT_1082902 [Paraphysoderma sedebokerense]